MEATRILSQKKKAPPIAYLLECSDSELGNFELARLADVANLRDELHAALDRVVDAQSLAALAAWLRRIDRQELKRELLKSPDTKIKEILAEAKEAIRNQGHSEEEAGAMPSPWLVRPRLPAAVAQARRSISSAQWQNRNIAKGLCQSCTEPLDRNSVRYCTKHLAAVRAKSARQRKAKGIKPGTHGRQPGTLANLALYRKKRSRGRRSRKVV